jgi:hypothetical protein
MTKTAATVNADARIASPKASGQRRRNACHKALIVGAADNAGGPLGTSSPFDIISTDGCTRCVSAPLFVATGCVSTGFISFSLVPPLAA